MRIIKIALILLGLVAMLLPSLTLASETSNPDTKTNINFSAIPDFLLSKTVLAAAIIQPKKEDIVVEAQLKTVEELKNDEILTKWKLKQAERWSNLPAESFTINASAYTASADECGNDKGITASGLKVKAKRTIACPASFPFGVKLKIEGYGTFVCEDRGGAIKGNHIDIYVETKKEAFAFGRRSLSAEIVE
ncbi:MAG: 3D domain-containing protein [Candidatus Moraniibacteriota bacterium]